MSIHFKFIRRLIAAALTLLLTFAQAADPIIVYSPQGNGDRGTWISEQAKAAGYDIQFLSAGGGELFDRLMAEQNNPQADIVFGLVDPSMALLKAQGMFEKYTPAWADELSGRYKDKDSEVYKLWQTPIVIAYNADTLLENDAPKGWLDLTKDEYKGKYVIGNLAWQTTRIYLAGMLARFLGADGEVTSQGWDFMRQFYDNAIVINDDDAKMSAFRNGEATIDLNWFGGAFRLAKNLGHNVTLVDAEGGTPFIFEGIAIVKGTNKLDHAKAFVDWFGSPEFMATYAEKFGQVPVHPKAIEMSPKKVQQDAKLLHAQALDWDVIAPKMDHWMQRIELEIR